MNTIQLECFVKVAETLSFVKAAEQLYISQPAVSKQIVSLEKELNAKLIMRSTHSCVLTPAGLHFLESARNILRLSYRAKQDILSGRQAECTLRIGYTDAHEMDNLIPSIRSMRTKWPSFTPVFYQDSWDINVNRVLNRETDLCFSFQKNIQDRAELSFIPLTHSNLVCIVPKGHPLAELPSVTVETASAFPQVLCIPDALKSDYYFGHKQPAIPDFSDQVISMCSNASEAYALVLAGMGYCLLPEYVIRPNKDLCFLSWPLQADMAHGMAFIKGNQSALLTDFIQAVKASVSTVKP